MKQACGLGRALLWVAALMSIAGAGLAQDYPTKPIRLVVPFGAGGTTDVFGRLVAKVLSERLATPVVVENKAGAGGNIGSDFVAKAPPDGYTLLLGATGHLIIGPSLYKNFPFDPVRDLAPVTIVGTSMNVFVVHPSVPAKTVQEFAAYAKANPGKLSFASGGVGGVNHLAAEMFKLAAGIDMKHVPYRGSAAAYSDLLSGRVDAMFDNLPTALPHITSGKLRALGLTGATRSPSLPGVPTIAEQGYPGFEATTWWGLFAPAGTPGAVIEKLNREVRAGMREEAARVRELGGEPAESTPEAFAERVRREIPMWAKVVKATGATAD